MGEREAISLTRDGNVTTATCDASGESAILRCDGTAWIGDMPNCTTPAQRPHQELLPTMAGEFLNQLLRISADKCYQTNIQLYILIQML